MANQKINDIAAAGVVTDAMQFETDIGGVTPNKVTALQIKTYCDDNIWDRVGTTISPETAGDDLDMGTGTVTATTGVFTGNVQVDGYIKNPTDITFTPQASPVAITDGSMYYDSGSTKFQFRENGAWVSLGDTSVWDRTGTTISPETAGDDLDMGTGDVNAANVDVTGNYQISNYRVLATDIDRGQLFVGYKAGINTQINGIAYRNTAIGEGALETNVQGGYNTAIGFDCLTANANLSNAGENTAIGALCLSKATGENNTAMGSHTGGNQDDGDNNVFIGAYAGLSGSGPTTYTKNNNTMIGYGAGHDCLSGNGNVFLGYMSGFSETGSNKLYIENSNSANPLIYGEFDTNLVKINGTFQSTGNMTIGAGAAGVDYTLTFDGEDNDGVITWLEDEDAFDMSCGFRLNAGQIITEFSIDGTLSGDSDAAIPTEKAVKKYVDDTFVSSPFQRISTTISPVTAGDDLDMGTGDITATDAHFTGKLTVDGLIDPTGLVLDAQGSAPVTTDGTIYYDSGTTTFQFRENGAWVTLGDTGVWERTGTTISPEIAGDDLDMGTGDISCVNLTATGGTTLSSALVQSTPGTLASVSFTVSLVHAGALTTLSAATPQIVTFPDGVLVVGTQGTFYNAGTADWKFAAAGSSFVTSNEPLSTLSTAEQISWKKVSTTLYYIFRKRKEGIVFTGGADYNPSILTNDYYIYVNLLTGPQNIIISTEDVQSGSTDNLRIFHIKDVTGNASTNNITISLENSGNIDQGITYVIATNNGAVTLGLNGASARVISDFKTASGTSIVWQRVGTTISPITGGDDLSMGAGDISATNAHFTGKLTVDGAIDPTMLVLDPQAVAPGTTNGTIYYDSVSTNFQFRENGAWVTLGGEVKQPNGFATLSSNQTINDDTWTTVNLATLESSSYDVTLSSNALVINTAGYYNVTGSVQLDQSGSGGVRAVKIRVDTGSGFADADEDNERESDTGSYQFVRIETGPKLFAVGDEIQIQVYQDSGGSLTLYANDNNTNLKVIRSSIS